ncbi:MAG: hypothetical protein GY832_11385 [Chloroflexi bacterium]|nr:hypothetical protein [Chloroflexota bacterium]
MKNHTRQLFYLFLILLLTTCTEAQTVPTPTDMPTHTPTPTDVPIPTHTPTSNTQQTINLHIRITDGQNPIDGGITIRWLDSDGSFTIGPTSDIVLPIPADGATFSVTVTAPGYQPWTETLKATKSLDLIIRLIEQTPSPDLLDS